MNFINKLFRQNRTKKEFYIILALLVIFAMTVSLVIGLKQSVWFDEAYSILIAKQPIADIFKLTALDTHPPLYYLLLKLWATIFGWSELSLRMLSIIFMGLAMFIGGLLIRKMFNSKTSLLAVMVLALSPLLLRYGFEIRMYSLASLIGVSATYCLYQAYISRYKAKKKWLIAYAILVALGMLSLYYTVFIWLVHVSWLLVVYFKKKLGYKALMPYLVSYISAVILFLPWLPKFINQLSNNALAPIGQPMNLEQLSGILSFNTLYQPSWGLNVILTAVYVMFIAVIIRSVVKIPNIIKKYKAQFLLLAFYILIPIVALMFISLFKPMYTERYLSHISIGLMLLLGVIVSFSYSYYGKSIKRFAPIIIIFGALLIGVINLSHLGNYNFQRSEHPLVNLASESLNKCDKNKQLIASDPYVATELSYYLPNCSIYFISEWGTLRGGYAPYSGSKHQIKYTSDITQKNIIYVFYNKPDQNIGSNYRLISEAGYGALNIAEYQRVNGE